MSISMAKCSVNQIVIHYLFLFLQHRLDRLYVAG
jgi:hypothetical protein